MLSCSQWCADYQPFNIYSFPGEYIKIISVVARFRPTLDFELFVEKLHSTVDDSSLYLHSRQICLSVLLYDKSIHRNFVWLTNHIVANCEAAKAITITSLLGPVAEVTTGILFAIVLSIKNEIADAVHKKVM